ncbi:MAG TPA: substrate-binding domain-containing protein, partial [Bryobacteraceae bacterium]|nr:substrate-binding domain-containing protein [Bryobacteraceae bacterium]
DAVLLPIGKASSSRRSAVPIRPGPIPDRLLIGGCDPALSILAAHAREAGLDVALAGCNSTRALELLQRGHIHIAGTHLHDPATGESNTHAVDRQFKPGTVRVITFASWQEGFVVAPGKAGKVRSAADLSDEKIQIVNREPGAGSRILLDLELKKAGVARRDVRGYDRIARGHLPAAWHVLSGLADCCIATESAARAFGLDFIPIRSERFDLVVPNELASSPLAQRLLEAMQRSAFRHALQALGGYDTGHTGRVVT